MSTAEEDWKPQHPKEIYTPGWHGDDKTPVVNGKYYDRKTGKLITASGVEYSGPPAVDFMVMSPHSDKCSYYAARPFPVTDLTCHIMRVVEDLNLEIDSLVVTTYTIRLMINDEMGVEEFSHAADRMANGIWDQGSVEQL
ncbi:hypothetical protein QQS21_009898 [Conoideocrella luteorostrata]|uniref:Uncharacterized protein n=1 Tax=Conoideocrella luteorostrata TaxID=1105319 RepID=A0AAJ0CG28_9HYPO|nr:hypothetical protein QQS21_009898 [Conoideocrella luteorostrata]